MAYFFQEAASGILRAWRASLLAVLTIAISLFVWGAFLLVERNLAGAMERWRAEARVIVYLRAASSASLQRQVVDWVAAAAWVETAELISPSEARRRFADAFPSLSETLEGWKESPLPPSIEIALRPGAGGADFDAWLGELAGRPGVESVDDDRDWIGRLEDLAATGRAVGLVVGLVLLAAAVLTTASVIRLATLTYREEISVMRIVGATEFLIRGPFYGEGLMQGGLGALLAAGMLYAGYLALALRSAASSLFGDLLLARFLSPLQLALLVVVGCVAGLLGATISLRGGILRSGAA
jgi:cell division transport system permease protein